MTVTSSGAAYGYHARNDRRRLTEDDPVTGSAEFAYSRHKAAVEALLATARRRHPELTQLVLRPGTILGAGTRNQITALFTGRFLMCFTENDGPFTFVWDEDVADIILAGVRRRRSGIYNVSGDGVMTMRDIARAEGKPVVTVPSWSVRAALMVGRGRGWRGTGPNRSTSCCTGRSWTTRDYGATSRDCPRRRPDRPTRSSERGDDDDDTARVCRPRRRRRR